MHAVHRVGSMILLAVIGLLMPVTVHALENGMARSPQMGWNTWNRYNIRVNESLVYDSAKAIKATGLLELGYTVISIDDGWQGQSRDPSTGAPRPDGSRFPNGIKSLVDALHDMGFKVGIYSSAGIMTCARYYGSLGYETIDAQTYAKWGIDYLKYDNCFNQGQAGTPKVSFDRYKVMSDALLATKRPIHYALCNWGDDQVHNWGETIANSWRIAGDVWASFDKQDGRCPCQNSFEPCLIAGLHCSIMNIIEKAVGVTHKGIGGWWPDLDGLEVGNLGMNFEEQKLQFSMWAITKSALMLGNDVTDIDEQTMRIINNKAVIAISQDPNGKPGYRLFKEDDGEGRHIQFWKGDLSNDEFAFVIINAGRQERETCFRMQEFFVDEGGSYGDRTWDLQDLWDDKFLLVSIKYACVKVPSHGVRMFRVGQLQPLKISALVIQTHA